MSTASESALASTAVPNVDYSPWARPAAMLAADVSAMLLAATLAVCIRLVFHGQFVVWEYARVSVIYFLFPVVFAIAGLYPGIAVNPIEEVPRLSQATTTGYLLLIGTTFFTKHSAAYSRLVFLFAWILSLVMVPVFRAAARSWCARHPRWSVPTVILGGGGAGEAMLAVIHKNRSLGLRPVALLDNSPRWFAGTERSEPLIRGKLDLAPRLAGEYGSCYAILAMPELSSRDLAKAISEYTGGFRHVLIVPDLLGVSSLWVTAKDVGGILGLEVRQTLCHRPSRIAKRCFDFTIAALALLFTAPLLAALAASIRLTSRGPTFYGQSRIGFNGKRFTAWKFRSMVQDADHVLQQHLKQDYELRQEWEQNRKLRNDPRVTFVGKLLRKTSLDELPQIWNVLRGEMSLVGPRPVVNAEVTRYGKGFEMYRMVRPGVTGLWQVSGRNNTTYEERVRLDEYYVRNWSMWLDLYILVKTVKIVLSGDGAY